jgi:hypothetical protein
MSADPNSSNVAGPFPPELPKQVALYSITSIGVATFLGGPLATGILAAINFRRFARGRAARVALLLGVLASIVLFGGIFLLPEEIVNRIPRTLLPAIYVPLAILWMRQAQGAELAKRFSNGTARKASGWSTTGISVACLIAYFAVIVPIALVAPPFGFHGARVKFGPREIHTLYVQGDIEKKLIDDVCALLVESGPAAGDEESAFQIRKLDAHFELSIPISKSGWNDPQLIEALGELRTALRESMLHAPVTIILVDEDLEGTHRKEF